MKVVNLPPTTASQPLLLLGLGPDTNPGLLCRERETHMHTHIELDDCTEEGPMGAPLRHCHKAAKAAACILLAYSENDDHFYIPYS